MNDMVGALRRKRMEMREAPLPQENPEGPTEESDLPRQEELVQLVQSLVARVAKLEEKLGVESGEQTDAPESDDTMAADDSSDLKGSY